MDDEAIATWARRLAAQTDLAPATVRLYAADTRRFAAWLATAGRAGLLAAATLGDAKDYRDALVAARLAPATVNRALVSLALFYDEVGRCDDNPFRGVARVDTVARAPRALTRTAWNAVRRVAEGRVARDGGLALALACLIRHAGPRVGEVAALRLPDVQLGARRGTLTIRRGKGLKHRAVPLVLEAREPLQAYLDQRRRLVERWARRGGAGGGAPSWAAWPDGHLFLGQRGPLTERGLREIVAALGMAAKLADPLGPHDLRHTFAKALLDPAAYGLDRPPAPITAVQELLGHAAIATTALYTRASAADLARIMGEAGEED